MCNPHDDECEHPTIYTPGYPMATTEAGGGVPGGDELRERLRESNVESRHPSQTNLYMRESDIDRVLEWIAAAGYVLVHTETVARGLAVIGEKLRRDLAALDTEMDRPGGRE